MKRHHILSFAVALLTAFGVCSATDAHAAPGSWRLHPSFDNDPERVVATPFGAYLFALAQTWNTNHPDNAERQGFLYRYDKDADEFEFLSSAGKLSENLLFSSDFGLLMICYCCRLQV